MSKVQTIVKAVQKVPANQKPICWVRKRANNATYYTLFMGEEVQEGIIAIPLRENNRGLVLATWGLHGERITFTLKRGAWDFTYSI